MSRKIKALNNRTVEAVGKKTATGFLVLQGSYISPTENKKIVSATVSKLRKSAKKNAGNFLQEDILFKSPSTAGMFVTGNAINGLEYWKTKDGTTLKDFEKNSQS